MPKEIERKYLVKDTSFLKNEKGVTIKQGYLCNQEDRVVRVRLKGEEGFLTIKSATKGITRDEYEYPIPKNDALEMMNNLCMRPILEKKRYYVVFDELLWEVDVFFEDNEGLVIAEIELNCEEQKFSRPDWLGEEVSKDFRYANSNLITNPYKNW